MVVSMIAFSSCAKKMTYSCTITSENNPEAIPVEMKFKSESDMKKWCEENTTKKSNSGIDNLAACTLK